MAGRPLVSMVLIAKDESRNVEACLSSFWDHVDEVVVCDTGSKDGTPKAVREFARKRKGLDKLTICHFKWRNNFAAARNFAHSKATGEWHSWVDFDDTVVGAENLRPLAANAPEGVTAFMCDYSYAFDKTNVCICTLKRERLVRADRVRWTGRVHEAMIMEGHRNVQFVDPDRLLWRHRKQPGDTPSDRNLKILEKWAEEEPYDGRVLQYVGTERAGTGNHEGAIEAYERYLDLPGEPEEHRAQVWRKLACSLIALERIDDAFDAGVKALAEMPSWPDCYLTLAQTSYLRGEHEKCLEWGQEVLRRGMPSSLLILNPMDYEVEPRVAMSGSLAALGKLDEACQLAEQGLAVQPEHGLLKNAYAEWLPLRKRKKTAETWLASAQMLVAHDEQEKALALLNTVPYFAIEEPRVVQLRSELRERLRLLTDVDAYDDHYRDASQPEDMIPDENVVKLCENLPRVGFLVRQVEEMLAV